MGDCNTLKSFPNPRQESALWPWFKPYQIWWIIALDNWWCPYKRKRTKDKKVFFFLNFDIALFSIWCVVTMSGHSQWQMIIWRIDVVAFFFPTYIINYTVWQISPFKPLTYSSFYILWSPTLLKTWYLQAQASFHSFYWTWVRSLATLVSLVDFIDLTLACEDANLKVIEVVTVADVDAEDCVGNSLLQIWKLRFGLKAKLFFGLWARDLVKILK